MSMLHKLADPFRSVEDKGANTARILYCLLRGSAKRKSTTVNIRFDAGSKALEYHDNGCGIEDMFRSVWMGQFIDSLPKNVEAIVRSMHMEVVLRRNQKSLHEIKQTKPIDKLSGISVIVTGWDIEDPAEWLSDLCSGYNIPVMLDGLSVARPHALDSGRTWVSTKLGMSSFDLSADGMSVSLYVDGLPALSSFPFGKATHVSHLDPEQHEMRIDKPFLLRNGPVVERQMIELAKAHLVMSLTEAKRTLPPLEFAQRFYPRAQRADALWLFNDVPFIPDLWLTKICAYPRLDQDGEVVDTKHVYASPSGYLTQAEIAECKTFVVHHRYEPDDSERESSAYSRLVDPEMIAHQSGMPFLNVLLDPGHWLFEQPRRLALRLETVAHSTGDDTLDGVPILIGKGVELLFGNLTVPQNKPFAAEVAGVPTLVVPFHEGKSVGDMAAVTLMNVLQLMDRHLDSDDLYENVPKATMALPHIFSRIFEMLGGALAEKLEMMLEHQLQPFAADLDGVSKIELQRDPLSGKFRVACLVN